jgi:hypothetical protein
MQAGNVGATGRKDRHVRVTAYHEAGHCAAALLAGEIVFDIRIASREHGYVRADAAPGQPRGLGYADTSLKFIPELERKFAVHGDVHRRAMQFRLALNELFVSGAGLAAESRLTRQSYDRSVFMTAMGWGGGVGDLHQALKVAEWLGYSGADAESIVFEVWNATAPLIRGPGWRAVTAMAEAVLARGDLANASPGERPLHHIGSALLTEGAPRLQAPVYLPRRFRDDHPEFQAELERAIEVERAEHERLMAAVAREA